MPREGKGGASEIAAVERGQTPGRGWAPGYTQRWNSLIALENPFPPQTGEPFLPQYCPATLFKPRSPQETAGLPLRRVQRPLIGKRHSTEGAISEP